jgi:acetyl esterase/lipase
MNKLKYIVFALLLCATTLTPITTASAATKAKTKKHTTTVYYGAKGDNSRSIRATYYKGVSSSTNKRWIMIIHGGYWRGGDRTTSSLTPAVEALTDAGYTVFNVNYPLLNPPSVPWSTTKGGVVDALAWIRAHANTFNINPNKGAIYGHSAGGHLALQVGLDGNGASGIKAIVTTGAPADPVRVAQSASGLRASELAMSATVKLYDMQVKATGCPITDTSPSCVASWNAFSPANLASRGDPAVLLYSGTSDVRVPYKSSSIVVSKLRAVGVDARANYIKGGGHNAKIAFDGGFHQNKVMDFLSEKLR